MQDVIPTTRKIITAILNWVERHPRLDAWLNRFATKHEEWQGFRPLGLRRDDILSEEAEIVRAAIGRLNDKEQFDRIFR